MSARAAGRASSTRASSSSASGRTPRAWSASSRWRRGSRWASLRVAPSLRGRPVPRTAGAKRAAAAPEGGPRRLPIDAWPTPLRRRASRSAATRVLLSGGGGEAAAQVGRSTARRRGQRWPLTVERRRRARGSRAVRRRAAAARDAVQGHRRAHGRQRPPDFGPAERRRARAQSGDSTADGVARARSRRATTSVTASRGPEYALASPATCSSRPASRPCTCRWRRRAWSTPRGYLACDFHQHTMLGADAPRGDARPRDLATSPRAWRSRWRASTTSSPTSSRW